MSYAVGIDLGTVNSRVVVYRNGKVETISIDGQPLVSGDILGLRIVRCKRKS